MSGRIAKERVTGATNFHRAPYEGISAVAALLAALTNIVIARTGEGQISTFVGYLAIPLLMLSGYRAWQTWGNYYFRTLLTTPMPPWMKTERLLSKQRDHGAVYLGKGFLWEPYHARLMKEISMISVQRTMDPPVFFRKMMAWLGVASEVRLEGDHSIHGCGEGENDLFVSWASRRTHTLVLGTNGAGKTRMLEQLIAQSISRGALSAKDQAYHDKVMRLAQRRDDAMERLFSENAAEASARFSKHQARRRALEAKAPKPNFGPVIILDPKGDPDLLDRAFATAKLYGREAQFRYFAPSRADCSFRINPLATYGRTTELANRIAALLPTGGDSEAFRQFAWRAVNVVVSGLSALHQDITLISLKRYIDGGLSQLLDPCLTAHLQSVEHHYPGWRNAVAEIKGRTKNKSDIAARAAFYMETVRHTHGDVTIDGMIQVLDHDAQHYSKLISNLIPVLEQLTSGPMERLLSPKDPETDAAEVTNFERLITENCIVYVNFDSLADSVVGSALGSLFLADLTACAARRHVRGISDPPVAIYVDEAAEMMNDPFIQALNKGRSAGFELTLASQTIADFVARMGNQPKAYQVLGNVNSLLAMRILDDESIEMVTEKFSETSYDESSTSRTSTTIAAMAQRGRDFSGSVMKGKKSTEVPLVPPNALRSLPPGHFFGHLPGGRKVKGRVMLMTPIAPEDRFQSQRDGRLNKRPDIGASTASDRERPAVKVARIDLDANPAWYLGSDIQQVALPE